MSTTATPTTCLTCGGTILDGTCLNVNCSVAQDEATAEAARDTAKATAKARPAPRAVNLRGNVD